MTTAMSPGTVPEWTLTDRLRKARELTELNAEDFAAELNVSRSTVHNYESPTYNKKRRVIVLKAWAMRAGVDYGWLVTGEQCPGAGGEQAVFLTKWYVNAALCPAA